MRLQEIIITKLKSNFNIVNINIINESHLHKGHHPDFDGNGETHFRIKMSAIDFKGKSRLECHRMVHDVLKAELATKIHALALELAAPDENKTG